MKTQFKAAQKISALLLSFLMIFTSSSFSVFAAQPRMLQEGILEQPAVPVTAPGASKPVDQNQIPSGSLVPVGPLSKPETVSTAATVSDVKTEAPQNQPGEVLVSFNATVSEATVSNLVKDLHAQIADHVKTGNVYRLTFDPKEKTEQQVTNDLMKTGDVVLAEPNIAQLDRKSPIDEERAKAIWDLYQEFYHHDPELQGYLYWLFSAASIAEIREAAIHGFEFKNSNYKWIQEQAQSLLGRILTEDELKAWHQKSQEDLEKGMSVDHMRDTITKEMTKKPDPAVTPEQTAQQAVINNLINVFGYTKEELDRLIKEGKISIAVDLKSVKATVTFDPSLKVANPYDPLDNDPVTQVEYKLEDNFDIKPIYLSISSLSITAGDKTYEVDYASKFQKFKTETFYPASPVKFPPGWWIGDYQGHVRVLDKGWKVLYQMDVFESNGERRFEIIYAQPQEGGVVSRDVVMKKPYDVKYHIDTVSDYDKNGQLLMKSRFEYLIMTDLTQILGSSRFRLWRSILWSITRTDKDGKVISIITNIGADSAKIKIGDQTFDITFKNIEDLLNQATLKEQPTGQPARNVGDLFQQIIGRAASDEELKYFQDQLASGKTIEDIKAALEAARKAIDDLAKQLNLSQEQKNAVQIAASQRGDFHCEWDGGQVCTSILLDNYLTTLKLYQNEYQYWGTWLHPATAALIPSIQNLIKTGVRLEDIRFQQISDVLTFSEDFAAVVYGKNNQVLEVIYGNHSGNSVRITGVYLGDQNVQVSMTDKKITVTDNLHRPLVIVKLGTGVLQYDPAKESATVTRYSGGSTVKETYFCIIMIGPDFPVFTPDDKRSPIPGFEEVLGLIIERKIVSKDGYTSVETYTEEKPNVAVSISVTHPDGRKVTVDLTRAETSVDAGAIEAALKDLLQQPNNGLEADAKLVLKDYHFTPADPMGAHIPEFSPQGSYDFRFSSEQWIYHYQVGSSAYFLDGIVYDAHLISKDPVFHAAPAANHTLVSFNGPVTDELKKQLAALGFEIVDQWNEYYLLKKISGNIEAKDRQAILALKQVNSIPTGEALVSLKETADVSKFILEMLDQGRTVTRLRGTNNQFIISGFSDLYVYMGFIDSMGRRPDIAFAEPNLAMKISR